MYEQASGVAWRRLLGGRIIPVFSIGIVTFILWQGAFMGSFCF